MRRAALVCASALLLSACASVPEQGSPAPLPASVALPVVSPEEAPLPEGRQLVLVPVAEARAQPQPQPRSRPVAPAEAAGKRSTPRPALEVAPGVRAVVPFAGGVVRVSMNATSSPAGTRRAPLQGPAWLKACKSRQDQGEVIMCDADALLAQPGDKVLVYTRDARKVGRLPSGGKVVLRESLPSVYRFFVLQ